MHRSITFRTHLTMNAATVLLIAVMLLVSHTFANPPAEKIAPAGTLQTTPTTISYQGHLTDAEGKSITGTVTMTFKLYAAPTGGDPLWTEQRTGANAVPVTNGLFKVSLGSVTPLDTAVFTQSLWLGIAVGSDAEMTPREAFTDVPYADVSGTVTDGAITSRKQTITTFSGKDATVVTIEGQVADQTISEFSFQHVPAGDVMVMVTLVGFVAPNVFNPGAVWVETSGTSLSGSLPTHIIQSGGTHLTLHSTLSNFAGGTLVLRVKGSSEQPQGKITFGLADDARFGRQVTLLAGL